MAKCKLDHEWELELAPLEHANEVQGLTILARVNNEHQGLQVGDVIEGAG